MINPDQKHFFDHNGYLLLKHLFGLDEVENYTNHYMRLRLQGSYPGDTSGVDIGGDDPLKKFPRMIHMHRWDQISLDWMIDHRIATALTTLMDREPFAVQTMLYFKPPKARGQALHQDQFYLRAQPGTCIAAWMALDFCDEENGCLQVVPGSHDWPLLCTIKADTNQSFSPVSVPIPDGTPILSLVMEPGDVLFFNGQVVHGSLPNRTEDRFRRALIGHYIGGEAEMVSKFYHPILRMNGIEVKLAESQRGGECGVWTDEKGTQKIEVVSIEGLADRTE